MNNVLIKKEIWTHTHTRGGRWTQGFIRLAFRIWPGLSNGNVTVSHWKGKDGKLGNLDNCSVWEAVSLQSLSANEVLEDSCRDDGFSV